MAGRPSGEKTRCGGRWTEAKFNSFVKSALRGASRKWAPIQEVLKNARTRRGFYRCAACGEEVTASKTIGRKRVKNILADHIKPIVPVEGWVSWNDCVESMFCELDNLQAVCSDCHDKKSAGEASERKFYTATKKQYPGEYNTWHSMKQRCDNPRNDNYPHYGGRGITYTDLWDSFEGFLDDMQERPEGHTLERLDVNKGYDAENCVWLPAVEQNQNKRNSTLINIGGEEKCVAEWCRIYDVKPSTASARIKRGLKGEDIFSSSDSRGKSNG